MVLSNLQVKAGDIMQEMIGEARFTIGGHNHQIFFEMTTASTDKTIFNSVVFTISEALYLRDCLNATISHVSRANAEKRPFTI